jgi:riboflavin kinase/FMN adenylyltransferase
MSAEAFGRFLRDQFPSLKKIVVGYDFRFGKDRRGTPETLKKLDGVQVVIVDEQKEGALSIHADTIRRLIREGDIKRAAELLGRPYCIRGHVIRGQGLGKTTFFPTLNIETGNFLLPGEGVYVTKASINGTLLPSVTFIGKRRTTDNAFSVETHILDHEIDTEIDEVEIVFLDYLRGNRKFERFEDLKAQIAEDIESAKRYHLKSENGPL